MKTREEKLEELMAAVDEAIEVLEKVVGKYDEYSKDIS